MVRRLFTGLRTAFSRPLHVPLGAHKLVCTNLIKEGKKKKKLEAEELRMSNKLHESDKVMGKKLMAEKFQRLGAHSSSVKGRRVFGLYVVNDT